MIIFMVRDVKMVSIQSASAQKPAMSDYLFTYFLSFLRKSPAGSLKLQAVSFSQGCVGSSPPT